MQGTSLIKARSALLGQGQSHGMPLARQNSRHFPDGGKAAGIFMEGGDKKYRTHNRASLQRLLQHCRQTPLCQEARRKTPPRSPISGGEEVFCAVFA